MKDFSKNVEKIKYHNFNVVLDESHYQNMLRFQLYLSLRNCLALLIVS